MDRRGPIGSGARSSVPPFGKMPLSVLQCWMIVASQPYLGPMVARESEDASWSKSVQAQSRRRWIEPRCHADRVALRLSIALKRRRIWQHTSWQNGYTRTDQKSDRQINRKERATAAVKRIQRGWQHSARRHNVDAMMSRCRTRCLHASPMGQFHEAGQWH